MNRERRKQIADIIKQIEALADLNDLAQEIRDIAADEQEAFDNMPESLQQSERGQASEAAISALEEAADTLEQVSLDDVLASLETAGE
jgi:hypothetical protein